MWHNKDNKQAGFELCQAQVKLGLNKLTLPRYKMSLSSFYKNSGHLPFKKNKGRLPFAQPIMVVFQQVGLSYIPGQH